MHNLIFFSVFSTLLFSCYSKEKGSNESKNNGSYDFNSPKHVYSLNNELKEISGIHYLSESSIACIQDEKGKIYFYNPQISKIEKEINFSKDEDYEDLTKAGDAYYVIRKDGTFFKFLNSQTTVFNTKISAKENSEGLCYDRKNNRLITACKDENKSVYAFDIPTSTLIKDPIFNISKKHISPSGINIHPHTNEFYVLSKEAILVLSQDGIIKEEYNLDPDLFHQPEGISFKENGDVLISNEAGEKKANILEFKYLQHGE